MPEQTMIKSALVIGASRGLGLGLVREFLHRGWDVTATMRTPPKSDEFDGKVTLEMLDINELASVKSFLPQIKSKIFDVVFINAGIGGPSGKTAVTVSPHEMTDLFMTNAISPIRLATKLLPNIRPGAGVLAFMTSILGSVSLGAGDFSPLYGASKSALNQLTRSFVAALTENITVLSLHPGWVKTDIGGDGAPIDVATSTHGLVDVLESRAGSHNHEFLDYQGKAIPW